MPSIDTTTPRITFVYPSNSRRHCSVRVTRGPLYPLTALGKTLFAEEKYREASSVLERALTIRDGAASPPQDAAETRFALARADWALDRNRSDAIPLATAARNAYRKLPGHDAEADEINAWLSNTGRRVRAL